MASGPSHSFSLCLPGWRAPRHIKSNRCTTTVFFFLGSWGNHKPNILLKDGFWGTLWANGGGKWINNRPTGTVNQQSKGGFEWTLPSLQGTAKDRAPVSQGTALMSKPAGAGSLLALRKWLSRLSAACEPLEANVTPREGWCSCAQSCTSPQALDPLLRAC